MPRNVLCICFLCLLTIFLMSIQSANAHVLRTDHFTIDYISVFPPDTESPLDLPAGYDESDYSGHPDYIIKLACWLEHAYSVYEADGFEVPSARVFAHVVRQSPQGVVTDPHTIWIDYDLSMSSLSTLACHEMFHIVQLQYWGTYPLNYPSIIEGMAEAMQITIIQESHYIESFYSHPNGHGWGDHDFFEFENPINDWGEAYDMTIVWLYLMEHSTDGTSPRYPGTDSIKDYLNAVGLIAGPTDPLDVLKNMLAAKGTSLDSQMMYFAFANLVRVYDNLDYWNIYGYRWDDSYFNEATGTWSIDGVDERSYGIGGRTLSLTEYGGAGSWMPGYSNNNVGNSIDIPYGAQYWIIEADQRGLIAYEGGLSYDGPGVPYSLDISLSSNVEYLAIAGLRDDGSIFHNTGRRDYTGNTTELRLDDDRIVTAAVAVTQNAEVSNYTFEYFINPYSREINFEETTEIDLDPHQILMLGIDHTGDALSAIAYWKEPWRGKALSADEQEFQMNYRRFDAYWYVNHGEQMIEPGNQDTYANVYIQSAFPGDYRLDLRQSPGSSKYGTLLVTLFNYDISSAALPDLLVRGYEFSLDREGLLEGQVAILNQGTATATNARTPIFVDSVLVMDPRVTIEPGETELIEVSYDTGVDCSGNIDLEPIGVEVSIYVNSNEGVVGPALPQQPELTRNNNGPVVVPVTRICLDVLAREPDYFLDEACRDLIEMHKDFMELQHQSAKFGLAKTQQLIEQFENWLGDLQDIPHPMPVAKWETLDAFQWFRAVSNWMTDTGLQDHIPPLMQTLRYVNNPSGAYYIIPDVLGLDIMVESDVHPRAKSDEQPPQCALTKMVKEGRNLSIPIVIAAPDETIPVPIFITDARTVTGADITIEYDANLLEVVDCRNALLAQNMSLVCNTNTPGKIILAMAGSEELPPGKGTLAEVIITVNDNADKGSKTPFTFTKADIYDPEGKKIPVGKFSGRVTVGPRCIKGDVNGDGSVNSSDAIMLLLIAVNLIEPTPAQICAADMNDDGNIGANDAVLILRR